MSEPEPKIETINLEQAVPVLPKSVVKLLTPEELRYYIHFHTSVLGGTGSGKTTLVNLTHLKIPYTSVFLNSQSVPNIYGIEIQRTSDLKAILFRDMNLNVKTKMVVSPHISETFRAYAERVEKYVNIIIRAQQYKLHYKLVSSPIYIFADEIHLYRDYKDTLATIKDIALTGRNKELFGVYITQRAQNLPKDLFTQSNLLIGLMEEFDDNKYLKPMGIHTTVETLYEFDYLERITGRSRAKIRLTI